jgi:galactose oxidase
MKNNTSKVLTLLALITPITSFADNSDTGSWGNVIPMEIVPVAVANLPNGNILTWSAKDRLAFGGNEGKTYTSIFDPYNETSSTVLVSNTQHDMFCPGINNLPDGRIFVSGGSGNDKTSIYNATTGDWEAGEAMNTIRGYQGQVTMGDGTVFTVGGSWSAPVGDKHAEIWTQESGWVAYPEITSDATVRDGAEVEPRGEYRDDNHAWLWAAPNGKVFHAGPSNKMHWIDPDGVNKVTSAGTRGSDPYAMNGTTVMYDVGKILKVGGAEAYGGGYAGSNRTFILDITTDTAAVEEVQSLSFARTLHNSVVLPNGEVLVIGGMESTILFSDQGSVLVPELWNPVTKTWKQLSAMSVPRNYHSAAILMEDGRVFAGGGGLCNTCDTNHPDAELFSPPYLFVDGTDTLATRPVINSAPATAAYGNYINVITNADITSMSLVRSSSATHSVNNEQRRIPLNFDVNGPRNYSVEMPSRHEAPPGNYMLFVMNSAGTPSVSKVVRLGSVNIPQVIADGEYWMESPTSGQRLAAPEWNNYQSRMVDSGVWNDQVWNIKHIGKRIYTIQNKHTGRYLEVENAFCGNYGVISGATSDAGNQRRWVITRSGSNFNFRPMHCKSQGLDRREDAISADAITWPYTPNHAPQLWNVKSSAVASPFPQGVDDTASTPVNTAATIDVLANDTGSGLTLSSTNAWSLKGGQVTIVGNNISYTPKPGFTGEDNIWYVLRDNQGRENSAKVTITVTGGVAAYPQGNPDTASTPINTATTIDVLNNDTGAGLTVSSTNAWSLNGGQVAIVNNKITYDPKPDYVGEDKVWYVLSDSQGRLNSSVVTITITGNAPYPVAIADTANTAVNTPIVIDVLSNDTGVGLSISDVNQWSVNGATIAIENNKLNYNPRSGYTGTDSFWYVITDSLGRTNAIQVYVTVSG